MNFFTTIVLIAIIKRKMEINAIAFNRGVIIHMFLSSKTPSRAPGALYIFFLSDFKNQLNVLI